LSGAARDRFVEPNDHQGEAETHREGGDRSFYCWAGAFHGPIVAARAAIDTFGSHNCQL